MKYLSFIIFSIALFGCSGPAPTPQEVAKANIEIQLERTLHDPESYQFVEMSPFDSVTNIDVLNNAIQHNMDVMQNRQEAIYAAERLLKSQREGLRWGSTTEEQVTKTEAKLESHNARVKLLKKNTADLKEGRKNGTVDTVYNYTTQFSYRAKNTMGALVLTTVEVKLGKDMGFVSMKE